MKRSLRTKCNRHPDTSSFHPVPDEVDMKNNCRISVCLVILALCALAFGQEEDNPKIQVRKARAKEITGIVLTSIGTAALATGVTLIAVNAGSFSSEQTATGVSTRTNSNAAAIGITVSVLAVPTLIVGIFKWTRGHDDYRYYKPMVEPDTR